MELSQLKVFFEVSEHLNFSKAAKKLHLSQPAVSIRIKSLEKSLNVELFKRSQNKLQLTKAGIETKKTCLKIFEEISLLQEKLNEEKHQQEKLNLFFNVNTQENLINKLILIFEDSLKELIRSRFNDDGPWPNSLQNLEEGKSLLLEANNNHDKELINLAINSIKKSL